MMPDVISRRRFLGYTAIGLVAAPLTVGAQQVGKTYRMGFLALVAGEDARLMPPFRERLTELGYLEGNNLVLDFRSANGQQERLGELARELVGSRPDVLIAGDGTLAPLALKQATADIPIVFASVGDPVAAGLVASLAHPGGNITGLTGRGPDLAAKRLQLLMEIVPGSQLIAVLMNPATPFAAASLKETQAAAAKLHVDLAVLELRTRDGLATTFDAARKRQVAGMIVFSDPLTYDIRREIADLANKFRLPTIYGERANTEVGGLISYAPHRREMYRRAADYADKILKGAQPADLPIEQPTKLELVINLKTAKALGLTIPPSLLVRADEVIE